jgi:uncharacterized circularly permuted ATP-grasp superfamily protein
MGRAQYAAGVTDLRESLRSRRCLFGEREIVKVLRPKLLTEGQYRYLGYVSSVVVGACRRLIDLALNDDSLLRFLGVREDERPLLTAEPRCPDPLAFCRLDSFETPTGFQFVELNAEAPAGAGYADMALEGLLTHPLLPAFASEVGATRIQHREALLNALLLGYRIAQGRGKPTILITDYLDLPTRQEFEILRETFTRAGFRTLLEDPRRLERRQGRLYAQGEPVDLVYRRVLVNELLERRSELSALLLAIEHGEVVMLNPFRSKIVHKKAAFAVLSGDARDRTWLTREERIAIDAVIPWTRRVRATRTDYRGTEVDLLAFLERERSKMVLKPNDEYGGKGVVLGWECEEAAWRAAIQDALQGDFVAQERVPTITEPYPLLDQGLEEVEMVVDLDPYVYFGKVDGVLARLAAGSLCNVTSGGGQTPVLLVPGD